MRTCLKEFVSKVQVSKYKFENENQSEGICLILSIYRSGRFDIDNDHSVVIDNAALDGWYIGLAMCDQKQ